jgi:hypothetical protein
MRTNLEAVPVEIRKMLIQSIRRCMQTDVQFGEILTVCPYDNAHFATYRYSQFNGIEMYFCHQCGTRFIMVKQGNEKKLISMPEKKQLIIRRK